MRKRVSVIIPLFNESQGLPLLVDTLNRFFGQHSELSAEVIFVNDGSTDGSAGKLGLLNHETYDATAISLSKNFGSHAALRAGIAHASGDYICFNYADLQDPLELIVTMKACMDKGSDIVWARRTSTEASFFERAFSGLYNSLMKKFAFADYPDKGFDIVMFNQKVSRELNLNVEANSSVFLQIMSLGFSQQWVSYKKQPRKTGKTKWTLGKKVKLMIDSFVAFSYAPVRMVSMIGIFFFLTGFCWTGYIIFRKLAFNDLAEGWPALVSILMVGFGVTNISLGILAEYLWRTLDASRNRPVYVVDEVLKLKQDMQKASHLQCPKNTLQSCAHCTMSAVHTKQESNLIYAE
jgi:glycosyltransferase involved in cell wall biosynthesis